MFIILINYHPINILTIPDSIDGKYNSLKNQDLKEKVITSTYGDKLSGGLSQHSQSQKSYEILEKSTVNSKKNLIQIFLIIIVCISLMVGYGLSGNSNAISNTYGVLCNTIIFFYKTVFCTILHFNVMEYSLNYYLVLTHNHNNYLSFFSFN